MRVPGEGTVRGGRLGEREKGGETGGRERVGAGPEDGKKWHEGRNNGEGKGDDDCDGR